MTVGAWDVVFRPAVRPRHVLAYGYDARAGVWVVLDPCLRRLGVTAMAPADFDQWRAATLRADPCDVWRMEARDGVSPLGPGLMCVGVVKSLLGLRSCAFRPSGLRRDMRRAGAVQVSPRESESAAGRPGGEGGSPR